MTETRAKLDRLLQYLAQDPDNLNLLQDAATAAFDQGEVAAAERLIGQYAALAPPPPNLCNLAGLARLSSGDPQRAAEIFTQILKEEPQDPAVRCNLAWAKAALGDWPGVSNLLDVATLAAEPRAAVLKVHAFQHQGRPEEALAWADQIGASAPATDAALLAALSAAALDAEDPARAEAYAQAAGDQPEALATRGFLSLDDGALEAAEAAFDRALGLKPTEARALLGKGLARMACNDAGGAVPWLDSAARGFETHLGSWIAAGWAAFIAGDLGASRQRFATALALDDTFAEAHGALAVLDLVEARVDAGRRGVEVALRLDRQCLSGLLGKMLLLQSEGQQASAERLRQMAFNMPIGPSGLTLASAMKRLRR